MLIWGAVFYGSFFKNLKLKSIKLGYQVFSIAPPQRVPCQEQRPSEDFLPCQAKNRQPAATGPQTI